MASLKKSSSEFTRSQPIDDESGPRKSNSRASSQPSFSSDEETATPGERARSALKIRLEILETLREEGPSRPTRIMLRANLSHDRLVRYLEELTSRGLLRESRDSVGREYALTTKGLEFVNQVKEAETFVAAFGITM